MILNNFERVLRVKYWNFTQHSSFFYYGVAWNHIIAFVSDLSEQVAKLQTELNAVKLQEFEAQEHIMLLTSELEDEKKLREDGKL